MTDKEINDTKIAVLHELRNIFEKSEKKEYTTEEIYDLLDNLALKDMPNNIKQLINH